MKVRKYGIILAFTLLAYVLFACSGSKDDNADSLSDNDADRVSVSNDAINTDATIIFSRAGFEKDGSKRILIEGALQEGRFKVIDAGTDKTVYKGDIVYKEEDLSKDEAVGYCDITKVDDEGIYYVKTETGIKSEEFAIGRDIYRDILARRISRFGEQDADDINIDADSLTDSYLRITDRLLAQEFFPESIDKKTWDDPMVIPRTVLLARSEIEILKDLADKKGSLKPDLNAGMGESYQYSAVMAMFSYVYEKYDKKSAGECRDLAVKVYEDAQKTYSDSSYMDKKETDDKRFWAAAQLYKLTGDKEYKLIAEGYADDPPKGFKKDRCGYLGTVAYLTCYNRIDLDVGELLITALMDDINDVVRESFKEDYYVAADQDNEDPDIEDLLEKARLAVLGNYISKNIKYVEAGENHLAFLYGRNKLGKDYAFKEGSQAYYQPMEFILAGLIDSYIYEDKEPKAMER